MNLHSRKVVLRTGIEISELGLGTAPLAGLFTSVSETQSQSVIRAALAAGIRYFDCAPHYGKGIAEQRLGLGLKGIPRSKFVISTKVGRLLVPGDGSNDVDFADADSHLIRVFDFSAKGVELSLKESMERLGLDQIEMVLIHDPDDYGDQALTEAFPALEKMRRAGLIKAIGVGMNQSALPTRFVRETEIDFVMIAGRYTLLDQSSILDLLPAALERGVDVIAAGVFNSGILANPVPGAFFHYAPASPEVRAYALKLEELLEEFGVTLEQAASQFPMQHPAIKAVVVGCRTETEVKVNINAFDAAIPQSAWNSLAKFIDGSGGLHG
jgi:D-threo-aldose 1-dehydrogenase